MLVRLRSLARPGHAAAGLAVALALLGSAQAAVIAARGRPAPAAAPFAAPRVLDLEVGRTPAPAPQPSRPSPPAPRPRRVTPVARSAGVGIFTGLGAWIDAWDFGAVPPREALAVMRRNGVRTLYLQTARPTGARMVHPAVGPWLAEAHRAGIAVVGWYAPTYASVSHDLRRMTAAARYRWRGHRFDGLGIDIEDRSAVRDRETWNNRVARHALLTRRALGPSYPLASIPPTPVGMAVAPRRWAGFPWARLARSTDAYLLMSYWSFRSTCPRIPLHCAYGYTVENVRRARALARRPDFPVHVIGGVADLISVAEVADFVRGAIDARAAGASLYDYRTTSPAFWPLLRPLRALGRQLRDARS